MPKKGLKGELDTVFSQFIKLRDDWTCRRCGLRSTPGSKYYDPAHIVGRGKESLRWDENNVFGMDRGCHDFIDGHPKAKIFWYVSVFGQDAYDALIVKKRQIMHLKDPDVQVMIDGIKERIKNHDY